MKIIVDSTTDLPKEVIDKYNIDVLPLRVLIDEKEYTDKETITVDEVYDVMKKGVCPKTSLPNPKTTYELFKKYASKGIDFIFYSFSSKLSSTFQNAFLVVEELKKEFPKVNMAVVDTKAGSLGSGLIALQGAKLAGIGTSFENILKISRDSIKHIEHIFTIDDLYWLLKGGRINRSSAVIGSALNIKPILNVEDGEMKLIKKIRGRKKALDAVVNIVEERIRNFPNQIIGIAHADDFKSAFEIKDMLLERIGHNKNIIIEKVGSVVGTHIGIGGVGVFFFNKKPELYINEL